MFVCLHCSRFHQFNNDNKLYFLSTHPSLPPRATLLLCLAGTLLLQQPARVCVTCSLCNSRALIPHKLCTRRFVSCSAHRPLQRFSALFTTETYPTEFICIWSLFILNLLGFSQLYCCVWNFVIVRPARRRTRTLSNCSTAGRSACEWLLPLPQAMPQCVAAVFCVWSCCSVLRELCVSKECFSSVKFVLKFVFLFVVAIGYYC